MNKKQWIGWDDIGYNFLVGGDGKIYEGRGWDRVGAQVENWNSKSVGISFIGSFMQTQPTAAALQAAKDLITCGVSLVSFHILCSVNLIL